MTRPSPSLSRRRLGERCCVGAFPQRRSLKALRLPQVCPVVVSAACDGSISRVEMPTEASAELVINAVEHAKSGSVVDERSGVPRARAGIASAAAEGTAAAGMAAEPASAPIAAAVSGVVSGHREAGSAEPFSGRGSLRRSAPGNDRPREP
jgi:hypothetical protein